MASSPHQVLIVGTGFAGLAMAIQLKKSGMNDFVILERASDLGGTWRDNHYPGAACDVPSHLYSLSFEPNRRWSRMFSPQAEILEYMKSCWNKHHLSAHVQFNTNIFDAAFDDAVGIWTVRAENGLSYQGRCLVSGTGGLSRPSYPNIPGLKSFKGELFHSAAWDHSAKLAAKRVAVIGTGASAIQIVPAIAEEVRDLVLFQRSAAWVVPKRDVAFSPLQMWLKVHVPFFEILMRWWIYWRLELFGIALRYPKFMNFAGVIFSQHLKKMVKDPDLRARLTPNYTPGCKRILLSDHFYPAVTRANVQVITDSISHIKADRVVTKDGHEYVVDALICATGFQAADDPAPFPIRGKNGVLLSAVWKDGAEAYRGTTVAGFPNFFMIVGPNTGLGHSSMVLMIESQVKYILGALRLMRHQDLKSVDVSAEKLRTYNHDLDKKLRKMVWAKGGCVSWYQTVAGRNVTLWPRSTFAFRAMLRAFDTSSYHCEPLPLTPVQETDATVATVPVPKDLRAM